MSDRKPRDPDFTNRALAEIDTIAEAAARYLDMRHPETGTFAPYYQSYDELSRLDILDQVVKRRDFWKKVRIQQGDFSQEQKKRIARERMKQQWEQEATDYEEQAAKLMEKAAQTRKYSAVLTESPPPISSYEKS